MTPTEQRLLELVEAFAEDRIEVHLFKAKIKQLVRDRQNEYAVAVAAKFQQPGVIHVLPLRKTA